MPFGNLMPKKKSVKNSCNKDQDKKYRQVPQELKANKIEKMNKNGAKFKVHMHSYSGFLIKREIIERVQAET